MTTKTGQPKVKEWAWDGGPPLHTVIDADGLMDPGDGWTHVLRPRLDVHPATLDAGRIAQQLAARGVTWEGAPVTANEVGVSWGGRVLVRADADPDAHWRAIDPKIPTPAETEAATVTGRLKAAAVALDGKPGRTPLEDLVLMLAKRETVE